MPGDLRTAALTTLALIAFASNSLLCRAALRPGLVDAASFTSVRVAAGALALALLARAVAGAERRAEGGSWPAALALFAYAAAFSYAYLRLDAGTGALILFGAVQATMNGWAIARGHSPSLREWIGLTLSLSGLVVLTAPGMTAPDPLGAGLMALAGAAWGFYSLLGRGALDPIAANAGSFLRAAPLALLWSAASLPAAHATPRGVALAAFSGAATSGIGYAVWYGALRGLAPTRAAVVQLAVPVLAALGGVLLLGERVTPRLVVAGTLVLGGIAFALRRRSPRRGQP